MKTRSGFVSNSSSSSFVIITTKDAWEEAVKQFTEKVGENIAKVVVNEYGTGEVVSVLGRKGLIFQGVIGSEEYGYETIEDLQGDGKISEDEAESLAEEAYSSMGEFEAILNKDGVSYVGTSGC